MVKGYSAAGIGRQHACAFSLDSRSRLRIPLNVRSQSNDVIGLTDDHAGNSTDGQVIHGAAARPLWRGASGPVDNLCSRHLCWRYNIIGVVTTSGTAVAWSA